MSKRALDWRRFCSVVSSSDPPPGNTHAAVSKFPVTLIYNNQVLNVKDLLASPARRMTYLEPKCLIAHPYVYCPPYKEEDDAWGLLLLLGLVLILGEKFATDGTNLVNDIAKTTATTLIGTPGPISILLPPILFN
ncbi:uncharacterized protein LOC128157023 [Crassostrea angulata]|uniref:uncharacterized protein LOC128157023 n=1 Tax=Magallana angulata TaxID=2784310 RepID=UPI0022B13E76|nr:uncharacterized protein LOC128157023 [Crassostrea angulata]